MRTIKLDISFDGTDFHGWQRQAREPTIQQEIERVVSLISNTSTTVHGAGRTDRGVHALGMIAHFQTNCKVTCNDFLKGLNSLLPEAIRINAVTHVSSTFHARFSALAKTYRYAIATGTIEDPTKRLYRAHFPHELSLSAICACLKLLTGTYDFGSFEATGSRDKTRATGRGAVRTIFDAHCDQPEQEVLHLFFTGDGFLRHMVRNMVGTIIEVGRGKRCIEEFKEIITCGDRTRAGATAPAHGLTLLRVHYRKDWS